MMNKLKVFFRRLSIKAKVIAGIIGAILAVFLYLLIQQKISAKKHIRYEIKKTEHEIELKNLEEWSNEREASLEDLKAKEGALRDKLKIIEEEEVKRGEPVSIEELDDFFDSRGF